MKNILALAIAIIISGCASYNMPKPSKEAKPITYQELDKKVSSFNKYIGKYPPRFTEEFSKDRVYSDWSKTVQEALTMKAIDGEKEEILSAESNLYRQGHNMDVEGTANAAQKTIDRCLELYPNSRECHFASAAFYLSFNPIFTPIAEKNLLKLRSLAEPQKDSYIEQGFVFLYLMQGDLDQALKQADYILSFDSDNDEIIKLRELIKEKRIFVMTK